ncbi:MAG TPA: hypothetical protein VK462_07490 [Nitrososphaeraceae archaeon]|nr:hypothetical protein [Nitrososphaeraceae archaeon]
MDYQTLIAVVRSEKGKIGKVFRIDSNFSKVEQPVVMLDGIKNIR